MPAVSGVDGMHVLSQVVMPLQMDSGYRVRDIGGDGSGMLYYGARGQGCNSSDRGTKKAKWQFYSTNGRAQERRKAKTVSFAIRGK